MIHRYGRLVPGEVIVLVATASSHREAAFAAASFLMDYLKTRAPFWKRVEKASGTSWVEAKSTDDAAAERWAEPRPHGTKPRSNTAILKRAPPARAMASNEPSRHRIPTLNRAVHRTSLYEILYC